jgi:lysozyme family protein
MQDNFQTPVLAFTLAYEGGKADDPRDPGGRTNQGITQRTYDAACKAAGRPFGDVFAMTAAERDAIYRTSFWEAVDGAALPTGVDLACFDYAVNSGPARARAALQRAGGTTAAAKDPEAVIKAICASRLSFLHALATFRTFGRGWTARVAACEALGVKMALHARVGQPVAAAPTRGTALILSTAARSASTAAARHRAAARTSGAATAVLAATSPVLGVAGHAAPTLAVVVSGVASALLTAILAWRSRQKATLATAYAAEAG